MIDIWHIMTYDVIKQTRASGALEENVQSQERPHGEKHRQEDPDTEQPVFLPVGPEAGEGKMIQG